MNTQSFTNGTSRLSRAVRRLECGTHLCYELSTSQFSDMKVRRLTRQYGFSGYSIYRYLVNETLHNGSYLLLWCEETAQAVASYWNASLEDVTRIVNGCIQVGLFNDELFRKHWGLTSADIQRTIWTMSGPVACSPGILVSPRSPNFRPADVLSTLNIKLMPKTAKKGFTYFRFETDHFYDPKVKRLKNKFGMEGWGVFHFIVNEIYRVEGCYMVMDADGLFDISDYSRMDEKKVSDIIDYCAELGLFNQELWQDKQILTSEEIQELYVGICKAIHRKPGIPESILLLETEPSPESAPAPHATCEQQDIPAHECDSPASLPKDEKEIRQAVTRIRTLFAAEKELREEPDKTRENKPYKIKENKISSPTPPAQASGEGEKDEDRDSLSGKLKYLGVDEYYTGWIYRLSVCYPEFPVGKAIEDILQSNFHLTKGNYLYPLVENYIAKYNAEYGEADRQRRQEETMRNRRKTLELLGVAVRDQQEILQLASVAPMVLDTALKETWGNKRIKSPTRFILSRMRQAVSA